MDLHDAEYAQENICRSYVERVQSQNSKKLHYILYEKPLAYLLLSQAKRAY